ncbi:MAG: 2-amino-4-hydroxy-6-hydroxymethyldihydropteridine diphosphokinase [Chloroflexi bacterium]|nr:MAG: 2-amino-4-hydroxy-6-hydroxymethyldihydropteridine diphosphokinase [Chloroflexota bacterium]
MRTVWLALGSNLGDREGYLRGAIEGLQRAGLRLLRQSRVAETEPVGIRDQPRFLNQVVEATTTMEPRDLLTAIKSLERELGRTPGARWGPREIDIDILLYGRRIVDEDGLRIPHPELTNRPFLLELLAEVDPQLLEPVSGETMSRLLARAPS